MICERVLGLSLSAGHADASLAVIRRVAPSGLTVDQQSWRAWQLRPPARLVNYEIERVETAPRMSYELLVDHVVALSDAAVPVEELERGFLGNSPPIVVDAGVGLDFIRMMERRRLRLSILRFVGTPAPIDERLGQPVSDVEMVALIGMLLEASRVTIGEGVSGAGKLLRELGAVKRWDTAPKGSLGEIVRAVAMPLYFAERVIGADVRAENVKVMYG